MKKINSFNINESDLATTTSSRQYTVEGEKDAEFILQVFNSSQQFYDFKTKSFSTTFTSTSSLGVKMSGGNSYNGSIDFPANASGDTYTILLLTPPDKDTELTFGQGANSYSTTITQVANTTLTFTPITASSANYKTFPTSVTSTTTPTSTTTVIKSLSWEIENTDSDARGFGLRLIRQPIDTDWYFTTTETVDRSSLNTVTGTVNGAVDDGDEVTHDQKTEEIGIKTGDYVFGTGVTVGTTAADAPTGTTITLSAAMSIDNDVSLTFITASTEVIVDDLTDIVTGMFISAVSGTNSYLIGTPTVKYIDINTKTLTLSTAQAFIDGITLTFQARGSSIIKKVVGGDIDFSNWNANVVSATSAALTKTVRTTSSSTTVNLNGTYGIAGGNHVTIAGVGVYNASANTVVSVSASSSAGSMVVTLDQSDSELGLTAGTTIYFTGSTQKVTITNTIPITRNPDANRTIYLNLDNFITVGAAS